MSKLTSSFLEEDVDRGDIRRITGVRVVDGIPGWALVQLSDGRMFLYAPENHVQTYGEIAREVAA